VKFSDLKTGEAYYFDRSTNWQTNQWTGQRAVLVSTDRYRISQRFRPGFGEGYIPDPKGNMVLVDLYPDFDREPDKSDRTAVLATQLRGLYESTRATVDAARERLKEAMRVRSQQDSDRWAAAAQLRERAHAAGFPVRLHRDTYDGSPTLWITPDMLAKLLDVYEAQALDTHRAHNDD